MIQNVKQNLSQSATKSFYEMIDLMEQSRLARIGGRLLGPALAASTLIASPAAAQTTQPGLSAPTSQPSSMSDSKYVGRYISDNEGRRPTVYDDGKGNQTIGIGHMLTQNDDSLFNSLFGPINMTKIRSGQLALTENQIDKLFDYDYQKHAARAKRLFPNFTTFPLNVKAAIIDGIYRGDLSGSPKTIRLINQDAWQAAAQEYLDNREYKGAKINKMGGVATRMDRNAKAFSDYAQQLQNGKN